MVIPAMFCAISPALAQQASPDAGPAPAAQLAPAHAQQASTSDALSPVPPPPADQPNQPAFRRGLLLMPFFGANLALGDTSKYFNLGYRAGGLAGWHVLRFLSLNGEFAIDRFAPIDLEIWSLVKATAADLAFSPFFHIALEKGDVVIGPRIGAFRYTSSQVDWTTAAKQETTYGLAYGLNLGVFGSIGDMAVGVLLGYSGRRVTGACLTRQAWSKPCTNGGSDLKHLSVSGALLF
jgi:hypothetical protein